MTAAIERARQIAEDALAGQIDPLLACRGIVSLREELPLIADEIMDVFVAVESECDELPIGLERTHWNAEALRTRDVRADRYRAQVAEMVAEALRAFLEATKPSVVTVHVELLDEGVRCWRPVSAERIGDDVYRILDTRDPDETWAFETGDVVRCRMEKQSGDGEIDAEVLVAYAKGETRF